MDHVGKKLTHFVAAHESQEQPSEPAGSESCDGVLGGGHAPVRTAKRPCPKPEHRKTSSTGPDTRPATGGSLPGDRARPPPRRTPLTTTEAMRTPPETIKGSVREGKLGHVNLPSGRCGRCADHCLAALPDPRPTTSHPASPGSRPVDGGTPNPTCGRIDAVTTEPRSRQNQVNHQRDDGEQNESRQKTQPGGQQDEDAQPVRGADLFGVGPPTMLLSGRP
jgi:hypothetical protein